MMRVVWSYGLLGAFGLASGLFILGRFSLALAVVAFAAVMIWLPVASRPPSTTALDKSKPASSRFVSILFWLTMFSFIVVNLLVSFANSSIFDGFPFDGPFQSFNPLRRMAIGEWPLIDFKYFHGNLLPLLLYPFYALFGKNLFAAELSRHLLDLIFFVLAMVILGRGLFAEQYYRRLFYMVFLATSLSNAVMTEIQNPILSVHSTIVRTFPQIIAFVIAIYVVGSGQKRGRHLLLESTLVGLLAAVVFLFTNEQGVYLAVTAAAIFLLFAPARLALRIIASGVVFVTFVAALVGVEMAMGWDGPIAAIRDIVADQVWYFGTYPNFFITNLADFRDNGGVFKLAAGFTRLFFVALTVGALVWIALRDKRKEVAGLLALVIYGLCATASSLGYFGLHYFDPLIRAFLVALLYFVYLAGSYPYPVENKAQRQVFTAAARVLKCARTNFTIATLGVAVALWVSAKPLAIAHSLEALPSIHKNEELGVRLSFDDKETPTRWNFWVDEKLVNTLFRGRADATGLIGYGATVAGTDGFFTNGIANLICMDMDTPVPRDFGVGDYLRVDNQRLQLAFVSSDRLRTCVGLYERNELSYAENLRFHNFTSQKLGIWFEQREQNLGTSSTAYTSFNESGAYKINGIYTDRPAVVLKTTGKRFGVGRGRLPGVGDVLEFASSGARKVLAVYPTGYVELDHGNLDPYRDGYPRPINIVNLTRAVSARGPFRARVSFAGGVMLVPSKQLIQFVKGKRVTIPAAGRTYTVIEIRPEGMIFLSDVIPPAAHLDLAPRSIFYKASVSPNLYYREGWEIPQSKAGRLPTIWSTYTGFPDAMLGQLNPSGKDYIIHALGKSRKEYLDKFQQEKPDFFVSMRSAPISTYNGWLLINHWNLFKLVLERYDIAAVSLHSIYWRRKKQASPLEMQPVLESANKAELELPSAAVGCTGRRHEFLEIDVKYRMHNDLSWLPVVGSSPRAFVYLRGAFTSIPVSINPGANKITFPALFLCDGRDGRIAFSIEGLGAKFARLHIERVALRRIESHHPVLEELYSVSNAPEKILFGSGDPFPVEEKPSAAK